MHFEGSRVRVSAATSSFGGRRLLTAVLVAAVAWSLASVGWRDDIVHPGGLASALNIARSLFRLELSPSFLGLAVEAAWKTVAYAVAGITLAVAIGLPLGVLASGTLLRSELARRWVVPAVRLLLAGLRSIHELVWAWLFVVAVGLSPFAAIMALAIPYGGILGRIYAEILQDVPAEPLRALRSAGASEVKVLLYGRVPIALSDMVSYTFYRLECGIRSAAILSFIGIAGLGYQIQLSLNDLRYEEVWTLLLVLVGLVALVDLWSGVVRRSLGR